jgi:hypothetical protein
MIKRLKNFRYILKTFTSFYIVFYLLHIQIKFLIINNNNIDYLTLWVGYMLV